MTSAKYEDELEIVESVEARDGEHSANDLNCAVARVLIEMASDIDDLSGVSGGGGDASAANQVTGNASLASIDSKLTNPLPVSAASLPLPAGAATSAKQDTAQTSLTAIAASVAGTLTVGLPSGAATSAKQDTGNTSLASIDTKLSSQATAANQTSTNTKLDTLHSDALPATTGAATSVAMTGTSATLIAANANRIGLIVYNPLSVALYLRFENADAAAVQSVVLAAGDIYEMPRKYYSGIVKGALASGSGNVFVTELT